MKLIQVILPPDTRANQPAANTVPIGTLYSVTDEGNIVEQSDGSGWVAFAAGGSGGTAVWGLISGLLSDQIDLQAALDAKVTENAAITPATKTKVTYDAKGLVTAGADATLASADFVNQGTATTVLHGNAAGNPAFGAVVEADITLADNTTNNVVSTKHGLAPKSPADAAQFLNGAATPAFAAVKDSDLSTSDITTNNVTTAKHGFTPKLPNDATKYLDGTGAYTVPAGSGTGDVVGPGSAVDGNLAVFDGTSGKLIKDGGAVPAGGGGGLLAITAFSDGSSHDYSTSSGSFSDMDATNLKVAAGALIVPASGKYLVRLSAYCYSSNNAGAYSWGLAGGITGSYQATATTDDDGGVVTLTFYVTGQTPGATAADITWQHATSSGTGHTLVRGGGVDIGKAIMEFWAA
jgi:hypothetical protein